MQQLHLVGFTTESDHLILSAKKGAKSGSFVVPLDERLLEVIAEAIRRRNADAEGEVLHPPPELAPPPPPPKRFSGLTPREIQARLRAGRTIAQVAKEAAADEDWVANFAPPVLAERERIIGRAREVVYAKPRRGVSAEPLGLSVRWNLADRGLRYVDDEFDACWSAFHIADLAWGITFEFLSRGRRHRAEWEIDFHDLELISRNRAASDLGYVEPGRRRRAAMLIPTASDAKKRAQEAASEASETSRPRATAPRRVARPAKTATKKSTARVAASRKATRPASAKPVRTATKKTANKSANKASAKKATAKKVTAKKAARRTAKATRVAKTPKTARSRAARTTTAAKAKGSKRSAGPRAEPIPAVDVAAARPAPAQQNELERRRLELVGKQIPAKRSPRAIALTPVPEPPPRPPRPAAPPPPPAPALDIPAPPFASAPEGGSDDAAKERREERRRARTARLAATNGEAAPTPPPATPPGPPERPAPSARPPTLPPDDVIPSAEASTVTINAARAAPSGGDVVVPGGPRPLRPALPAAQPKRRRFGRSR